MDDRNEDILKQYDMKIYRTYRARGAYILETDKGLRLCRNYSGTVKRAQLEHSVQRHLQEQVFPQVDLYVTNRLGELLSEDPSGERYIVKEWYQGEECNLKNEEEILMATQNLAKMHQVLEGAGKGMDFGNIEYISLFEMYDKHMRELRRVKSYIRNKKGKNEFEVFFLNRFDLFYEQTRLAMEQYHDFSCQKEEEKSFEAGNMYHGNYTYHNLLISNKSIATIGFEKTTIGNGMSDLYFFMRKLLEKNDWNVSLGHKVLDCYQREKNISKEEGQLLYVMLQYPEKFWKIANSYYNSKKSRLPGRNMSKLTSLSNQAAQKEIFMKSLLLVEF